MAQQEFFVRQPESEDAAGPYTIEKLMSLADIGKIGPDSLYYDDVMEQWMPLQENETLKARVFPEKRKLSLRKRDEAPPEGTEPDPAKPKRLSDADKERPAVTVHEMLAAAEADTEETRHIKERQREEDKGALMGLQLLALSFLLSAAAFVYPTWLFAQPLLDDLDSFNFTILLEMPHPIFLVADLLFALLLLLGASQLYPLLRIRAMVGVGYFGYIGYAAWVAGSPLAALQVAGALLFAVGVFVLTLKARLVPVILGGACAIIGVLAYGAITLYPLFS